MKTETKVFILLTIHCGLLLVTAALSAYWLLASAPETTSTVIMLAKFKYVLAILALILGMVYFTVGYKKNAYLFYRSYMALFGLDLMISIVSAMSYENIDVIPTIATVLSFASATILATGKDLGKGKSYTLALSLVVCAIVIFVYTWLDKGFVDMELVYVNVTGVLLSLTTLLMVIGKYYDKKMRGAE